MRFPFALAGVVAASLALAGCASSGGSADELSQVEAELIEFGSVTSVADDWRLRAQQTVAVCMKAEGFDFIPETSRTVTQQETHVFSLTDVEWARTYGYGVVSSLDAGWATEDDDPNLAIIAALTATENEAYMAAMFGDGQNRPGCAQESADAHGGATLFAAVDAFEADRQRVLSAVSNSPALVEPYAAWVECMRGHGYQQLDSPSVAKADIERRSFEALDPLGRELASLKPEQVAEVMKAGLANHPLYPQAQLDEIQASEIVVATFDAQCTQEHVSPTLDPMIEAAERQLLDDNVDLIGDLQANLTD